MVKLKKVAIVEEIELIYGKSLTKTTREDGPFNVYGSNGVIGTHSSAIFKGPGIIVGRKGTVGSVVLSRKDFYAIDTTYVVKLKDIKDDLIFWYYFLKTLGLENMNSHSAVPGLSRDAVYKKEVQILENFEDRVAVAKVLLCLDEKIELNNSINKNLEEMAQAIFKSWFVDFEPFQDGEFEDSELGRIPKGWKVVELSEISTVQNGYAFKSTDYQENGCNMIRTTNIGTDGFVDNIDLIHLPHTYLDDSKYANFRFNNLDTVLVMVGASVGKIGIITEKNIPSIQNQNMWRFRPIQQDTSPIYIHYYVRLINERVQNWSSGSAREFYRKDSFQNAKCIYPTGNAMNSFNEIISGIFNRISLNIKESETLTTVRNSILPKLMSGEIRVPTEESK